MVSNEEKFQRLLDKWGVKSFTAKEFFYRGASDQQWHINSDPPAELWANMEATAKTLEEARKRLGEPIRLTSVFRNEAYNRKVNGVRNSRHRFFDACDCVTAQPAKLYLTLLDLRREGYFKGGLGLYRSFVHIDSRGHNATWRG